MVQDNQTVTMHTPSLLLTQLQYLMRKHNKMADDVECVLYYDGRAKLNLTDPSKNKQHFHKCSLDDFIDALVSVEDPERDKYHLAWDFEFKLVGNGWWIECNYRREFSFYEPPMPHLYSYKKGDFNTFFKTSVYEDDDEDDSE